MRPSLITSKAAAALVALLLGVPAAAMPAGDELLQSALAEPTLQYQG